MYQTVHAAAVLLRIYLAKYMKEVCSSQVSLSNISLLGCCWVIVLTLGFIGIGYLHATFCG